LEGAGRWKKPIDRVYSVREWGIKGTGLCEGYALQGMLDHIGALGGGTLYFPRQVGEFYATTATLNVRSNTRIVLEQGVVIRNIYDFET
jgi:polygalacturonase